MEIFNVLTHIELEGDKLEETGLKCMEYSSKFEMGY